MGGCGSYFFIRRVPGISHTPGIISSLVETSQNGIQHGPFLEVAPACPNLSFFPLFLPSSFQQEAFGCDCFFLMFCPVSWLVGWLWQLLFYSKGSGHLTYPWNHFFPGGNLTKWHSTWHFPGSGSNMSNLSFFPLFLQSSFQQEAFGCDCFFFKCFVLFLGWLGGCGSYFFIRWVPDISHTPRIISSPVEILQNGIQHASFLEVAPTCPNLSFFDLFLPSSCRQEAFGCDCFFMFCPVSGLVGWLWQLNFYSNGSGHLTYP